MLGREAPTQVNAALARMRFNPDDLFVEGVLTEGTSNILVNLALNKGNHKTVSWAVKLIIRKRERLSEHDMRLIRIHSYLTEKLRAGRPLDQESRFVFDSPIFVAETRSVLRYLKSQAQTLPGNSLSERLKEAISFIERTGNPIMIAKGAPSWLTLEYADEDEFETWADEMIRGLAVLHGLVGHGRTLGSEDTLALFAKIDSSFGAAASTDDLVRELDANILQKYRQKWKLTSDANEQFKSELYLRLVGGRKYLKRLVGLASKPYGSEIRKVFVHGDPHGGNFIVVKSAKQRDIHMIDMDDSAGLSPRELKPYLYDILEFLLSAKNLSSMRGNQCDLKALTENYVQYFR